MNQDITSNTHGRYIIDLARRNNLICGTGRYEDEGLYTYHHTQGNSRPDHFFFSHNIATTIRTNKQIPTMASDHDIISCTIQTNIPTFIGEQVPASLKWNHSHKTSYSHNISAHPDWSTFQQHIQERKVDEAYDTMTNIIRGAATGAGMTMQTPPKGFSKRFPVGEEEDNMR